MADNDPDQQLTKLHFDMLRLKLSDKELAVVSELYRSFAGQRARLAGTAQPESEPMIIPAFDRMRQPIGSDDERIR